MSWRRSAAIVWLIRVTAAGFSLILILAAVWTSEDSPVCELLGLPGPDESEHQNLDRSLPVPGLHLNPQL